MTGQGGRPCWAVVSEYGVEAVFTDADTADRYVTYLGANFAAYRGVGVTIKVYYLDPDFT